MHARGRAIAAEEAAAAAREAAAREAAAREAAEAAAKVAAEAVAREAAVAAEGAAQRVSARTRGGRASRALVAVEPAPRKRTLADFQVGWWAFVPRVDDHGFGFSTWCQIVKHEDGQVKVAVPGEKRQKVALRLLTVEAREEAPLRLDSES